MSMLPDKTTPVTHNVLSKSPYVRGCIKESMRLFPIASNILRTMQTDVTIGGYIIPKGVRVIFLLLKTQDLLFNTNILLILSKYFSYVSRYLKRLRKRLKNI